MALDKLQDLLGSTFKYLGKAITARESFYQGLKEAEFSEAHQNERPIDRKYAFGKSQRGSQLIADNKWHMAQARTFALASIAHGIFLMIQEQKQTNVLLKEVRDAVRRR